MTRRTLPDELRSVLLSHSMDAPEPDGSIERVLAETVGIVPESAAATDAPAGATGRPASPLRRVLGWRPSGQLLAAAVLVAVVVLAAAGINTVGRQSGNRAASTAGSAQPADRPIAGPQSELSGQPKPNVQPMVPSTSTGALPSPPLPAELGCASLPAGRAQVGATALLTPTGATGAVFVYEFRCVGANGQRSASEVQAFAMAGGALRRLATVLPVAANRHVDYLSGTTDQLTIQASDPSTGEVGSTSYRIADAGRTFSIVGSRLVARGCQRADLTARVIAIDGLAGSQHHVLQLTNKSSSPCALEGFPKLVAGSGGNQSGPGLDHTLNGPAGGVLGASVPPIVVLIPGGTAGAILEYGSTHPNCAPTSQLAVTLPTGVSLGAVPATLSVCGMFVHPLVDNPYGTL